MGFLKGLALSILGFLLFVSLSLFAVAFTLNSTTLNPDFIVSEIDRFDVALLVEAVSEEMPQEDIPEELKVALIDTITKLEPVVKEQLSAAIYPVYDYLLGRSESLDLAGVLGDTFLSPDFAVSVVDELDIPLVVKGFLAGRIIGEIPEEMKYAVDYVDDALAELKPWIKEQAGIIAAPVSDYLLGKSQSFRVVISLEPVKESLRDTLQEAFMESLPSQFANLPFIELEQHFDELFEKFAGAMPSTFELDESMVGTEVPTQIAEALAVAEEGLEESKQYVGIFQFWYKILIGFMLLLILGLVLINRQVRGACRRVGSIFLTFSIPAYLGFLAVQYFDVIQAWILQLLKIDVDIPMELEALILQSTNNFLAPVRALCLGILIGGVVLLVVSFVYKPREPSD